MRINRHPKARQQAIALLVVMRLGSLLTLVLFVGSKRTAALKQEIRLLETRQKARLEKMSGSANTNVIKHGQSTRH
jgi:hypothetical protein